MLALQGLLQRSTFPFQRESRLPSVPMFSLPEVCPPQLQLGSTASSTHTWPCSLQHRQVAGSPGLDPTWASSLLDFALPQALPEIAFLLYPSFPTQHPRHSSPSWSRCDVRAHPQLESLFFIKVLSLESLSCQACCPNTATFLSRSCLETPSQARVCWNISATCPRFCPTSQEDGHLSLWIFSFMLPQACVPRACWSGRAR